MSAAAALLGLLSILAAAPASLEEITTRVGAVSHAQTAGGFMAASQLPGRGRLVLLGDSSPADDGSCQCSASLQNGWGEASNAAFILNATAWLAHDGS